MEDDPAEGREVNDEGQGPEELMVNHLASLNSSSFNPLKPTKILIHGWSMSLMSKDFPGPLKDGRNKDNNQRSDIYVFIGEPKSCSHFI